MKPKTKIGILTSGGDCPGLNAVIRSVTKTAINVYDMEVMGFEDGFEGLVENRKLNLTYQDVSNILTQGGTILGTSNRADPFRYPLKEDGKLVFKDRSEEVIQNFDNLDLEALVVIGGEGTMIVANRLTQKGMKIVGVPKTIDNDLYGTDQTFGFDSALVTATEAIDKIHTTAQSHHRVMVIEVMGRYAGWLALGSGLAGGGDIILIPEIPYDIDIICEEVEKRSQRGKRFSILVIGEGALPKGGKMVVKRRVEGSPEAIRLGGIGNQVAAEIEEKTKVATRVTVLGHLLRGGVPSPFDRILATRFGVEAMKLVIKGDFGKMVALHGQDIVSISLKEIAGKIRKVPLDSPLIQAARCVGTCLGD